MAKFKSTTAPVDMYAQITDTIIEQIENGVAPWKKNWNGESMFPIRANGQPYSGINVLILWATAMKHNFSRNMWMTYKQAEELGGNVRKGEKSVAKVVYYNSFTYEKEQSDGTIDANTIPTARWSSVFNVVQIENLPDRFYDETEKTPINTIQNAEDFFATVGVKVNHGGDRAFYVPSQDYVQMPNISAFTDSESYYATLAHETIHWSGAKTRCDRDFGKRFGDNAYAAEELVAEIGAAFLAAELGLYVEPREDHAAYISHWLKVMREDKKAIFTAASKAQQAVTWIKNNQMIELQEAA